MCISILVKSEYYFILYNITLNSHILTLLENKKGMRSHALSKYIGTTYDFINMLSFRMDKMAHHHNHSVHNHRRLASVHHLQA